MKRIGATQFHRLLAALLALTLVLTGYAVPAKALVGWENVTVAVTWTDAQGAVWTTPAWSVPEDQVQHGYWVTLPEEALGQTVNVIVMHPDPGYVFFTMSGDLSLPWTENALDLHDDYAQYIGYYYNGAMNTQMSEYIRLYLSTSQPPFEVEAVETVPGTEVVLPGDAELIVPQPGGTEVVQPAPSVSQAVVTVYYKLENGQTLDVQDVTLTEGTHTLWPESAKVGGYELVGDYSATVTVYAGGYADAASVTFLYREPYTAPAEATVDVYYMHENGVLLDQQQKVLGEGTHTLYPESARVGGYELAGDSAVTVTVDASGYTDVASVTFWYKDVYVAPVEASLPVYYYHENGQLLDEKWLTLPEGTHTIVPESSRVSGLEMSGEASATVTVYADGSKSAENVVFLYRDAYVAPVTGELTVIYLMENGQQIEQQVITLAQGEQTVWPESQKVGGLELVSDASVRVFVDGGGAVSPNPVQFVYREPVQEPVSALVTVYYYDTMGNELLPRQTMELQPGTHQIEAPAGNQTSGYELISEAVLTVTVNADGSYSPSGDEVSFWYRPVQEETVEPVLPEIPSEPVQQEQYASVTVRYLDDRGNAIASEQTVSLGNGTHVISPDPAYVPAGYESFPGTETATVTVSGGRANKSVVSFYFTKAVQAPSSYPVTVYYYDTFGREIAPRQTLQLQPGTHWIEAQPEGLTSGYELASEAIFALTVGADGSLDRVAEDVGFWYSPVKAEPKSGYVTVNYVDGSGRLVSGPYAFELTGDQTYTIKPDEGVVPTAYDASGCEAVQVYVSAEGIVSPSVVSFVLELRVDDSSIPVGQDIGRYGVVNGVDVAVRTEPYTSGGNKTVIRRMKKGSSVYMVASEYNTKGETWTQVIVDGVNGYMQTKFIDMLTVEASDVYAKSVGATPVPTFTPEPTATPTPSPEPTESFVESITPVPVTPTPYVGYAVTQMETALRTGVSSWEYSIIQQMEVGELVIVKGHQENAYTGESWSLVQTLNGVTGYVPDSALRQVSEQEAAWYMQLWQQQNATPAPTELATNTPEPMQLQGYGYTLMNNVPFRQMASEQSRIIDNLEYATVVYIAGQTYSNGVTWHSVLLDGSWGYIREDLLRLMTIAEEDAYLNSLNATPTPTAATTNRPYDENGLSSYGYVTKNSVNFRAGASTSTKKLDTLNRYALCLVLGTEYSNGVTWYRVNYERTEGYIHGDYFKQMTVREFNDFYGSDLYEQGLRNNSDEDKDSDDTGYTGTGGQITAEDQIVDDWYSSGNVIYPSYEPFVPVGTVEPINPTATPTLEPLPGYVNPYVPTATPVVTGGSGLGESSSDLPLPGDSADVIYPTQEQPENNSALVVIIVIVLLLLAGGGAVALVQHQRRRRRIAMRAAQRRAQQARNAGAARPYARQTTAAPQNRTGAYPQQQSANAYQQPSQLPVYPQTNGTANQPNGSGYAQRTQAQSTAHTNASDENASAAQNVRPYARQSAPAGAEAAPQTTENGVRRVGRRTAYQQALAEQQRQSENNGE